MRKMELFQRNFFLSKFSYGQVECSFDNTADYFSGKRPKSFTQSPRMMHKSRTFKIKNFFSPKCSYDRLQCSFDNPAAKFVPEGQDFSLIARNWWKDCVFQNVSTNFFRTLQCSSVHVGCIFKPSSESFCQKAEICSLKVRKWSKNENSSR